MINLNLHKVLYLYKTPSKFYIQPVGQPNEALIIDRQTTDITLNSLFSVGLLPANATSCLIYGIIGIKHLFNCPYLIVITKATSIGVINDETIFKMEQAQIIPFNHLDSNPNKTSSGGSGVRDGQNEWNDIYVSMLESVLKMPGFYFSYSYDLTNSLQRINSFQCMMSDDTEFKAHHFYDKRFLWNNHMMSDFDRCGSISDRYRLPFILGFVNINQIPLGQGVSYTQISRRSVRRAGTRFNSRGIDHDGNVSNFVETEQIIEELGLSSASFIQIRGSIPLVWNQKADYKLRPTIMINPDYDHVQPMKKHFDELKQNYGDVSVISLIDKRGDEGQLNHEFSQQIGYLQKESNYTLSYHYFDFHRECSKMRWHRLSILIDQIQDEIENYGYFEISKNNVIQMQRGVFRSNCIDSLDRTNVVQSLIAKHVLNIQLSRFKTLPANTMLDDTNFLDIFKNTWADNADALSTQYAGTPALKTDFTRFGQRTHTGLMKDGLNALTRYVNNNFFDSYRQDAIELFLGYYEGYPSPLYRPSELTSYTSTIPVTLVMLTLVVLYIYLRY